MQYLKRNKDFKVRLADRIQKHLINEGGALTPASVAERYNKLANEIDMAIISESARWSDWYPPFTPYTKNDHWIPRKEELLTEYFPERTNVLLSQLTSAGLFPRISAPTFSHEGGEISSAINLSIYTSDGTIYYTTDGTDPRAQITDTKSTTAQIYSSTFTVNKTETIKARVKSTTEWSAMSEVSFDYQIPSSLENPFTEQLAVTNSPNPFSESTLISYTLAYATNIQLSIYGIDGKLIEKLYNGPVRAGRNTIEWVPENIQSGIYICRINFEGQSSFLKLVKR
jgi:hypothetical protein